MPLDVFAMVYQLVVIGLVILFIVSLTTFIKNNRHRHHDKNEQLREMNRKLDRIIELLEDSRRK
ncbi:DUF4083 family protein [Salipaludibacillus aurantiacus]|uniref:DUF4083 domain-containing protein n=1 Tax=Salipaludibacillus aurantiacus TaxID=1601833 RepID=A0A1H9VKQ5_9BACI|nr:DUF4083 family protein [Salipaludibacillus aurantiacus]SES22356.1 protein of unknown function [Salipaludibacillus aurantiacus]